MTKKQRRTIEDMEEVLSTTIELIMESDPILHSGRLSALVNSWAGLYKLNLEDKDIKELKEDINEIKKAIGCDKNGNNTFKKRY